jgi:hypothetical protein
VLPSTVYLCTYFSTYSHNTILISIGYPKLFGIALHSQSAVSTRSCPFSYSFPLVPARPTYLTSPNLPTDLQVE